MQEQMDILEVFRDRVRRHIRDASGQYRDELNAVSHKMAADGLYNSGPHLKRRVAVLRSLMVLLTDQCFEDVTRLPGTQNIHRIVHTDFLREQLHNFLRQAEVDVLVFKPGPAAINAIDELIKGIREGLDHDLHEFQAGIWISRLQGKTPSVINNHNTVNNYGYQVGVNIHQGGDGTMQSVTVEFNAGTVQSALNEFVAALKNSDISDEVQKAAAIEIETIRPQLQKTKPNVGIVHQGLRSLRNILEEAAAGILSAKLLAVMAAAGMGIS